MTEEAILCKTTAAGLEDWLKSHLAAQGYDWWAVQADSWQTEPGAWAEGLTWIAPSRRAIIRLRVTIREAELVEVAGEIVNVGDPHPTDPGDEAELAAVLDAIRARFAAPAKPTEGAPRLPGRGPERRQWIATWEAIQPLVEDGKSITEMQTWLGKHKEHLWASEETIRKIIAWGEAGAKT